MTEDYGFETYGCFKPTEFDSHIEMEDREHWQRMPVIQTRDSGPLDQSNFAQFLEGLGGESDTVEVHRFGHWGPGWFEIILVDPADQKALAKAYDMARALEDYPVLDEEDMSRRESDLMDDEWQYSACSDFCRDIETLLESIRDDSDAEEPWYEKQDFCQFWRMPVDLCGCGECITTVRDMAEKALQFFENIEDHRDFAEKYCNLESYYSEHSSSFRWKLPPDQELIEALLEYKQVGTIE